MNTQATTFPQTRTGFGAAVLAALLGLGIIMAVGHLQAGVLHGAAHDVRHANGFPCH